MNNYPAIALNLGDITVRQHNGLFSLNDLHRAAGAARRHEPARFIRLDGTKALIAELGAYPEMGTPSTDSQTPMRVINDGENNGTYACRELVIAYAAWISAAFHLKVIRVFLAAVQPQRPHNPALDYERLSPSQKQDLKELVHAIAEAKVQSHGETWARLHNKFRVNSYHELPASQFAAARDYLLGKLPEAPAALPAPAPTLRNRRWLIATDHEGVETVQPIGPDDFVSSWPHLVAGVHNGNVLCTNAELLDMASACMQRLQQRSARAPLPALGR